MKPRIKDIEAIGAILADARKEHVGTRLADALKNIDWLCYKQAEVPGEGLILTHPYPGLKSTGEKTVFVKTKSRGEPYGFTELEFDIDTLKPRTKQDLVRQIMNELRKNLQS